MTTFLHLTALLVWLLPSVLAQSPVYGQCGGIGWTGATTCASGSCCTYSNDYYSQCIPGSCTGGGGSSSSSTVVATTTTNPASTSTVATAAPSGTFKNPVIYEDLADNDVFRVNDTYYYSASTMHYSPGAPILQSYDLVNWQYIGHSVPSLSWSSKYNLVNGQNGYVKGIWASTMRYRKSTNTWYWIGCIEFTTSYVYTAPAVTGPWTQAATINTCFYDCGLLIDDDDTMYVAYNSNQVKVAQLASNGLSIVKSQQVFDTTSIGTMEGNRFYKRNGLYYIADDVPANAEYVWKASSPWGPYTSKALVNSITTPIAGTGNPHQGSLVDTPSGQWYYMSFVDSYPLGRVPVLAPITWGSDGFPTLTTVNGGFGASYPMPAATHTLPAMLGTDSFSGTSLGPQWEWNHNPDTTKFSVNNGLTLNTATVTFDLYTARNTLTKRVHGPATTGTVIMDFTNMADGDRAGLAAFRFSSAWIGIKRDGSTYTIGMTNNITQSETDWSTTNTGTTVATASISVKKVWFRAVITAASSSAKTAVFSYSTDGNSFTNLGPTFPLNTDWQYFMGYRWGIFNYATTALGGSVKVSSFTTA